MSAMTRRCARIAVVAGVLLLGGVLLAACGGKPAPQPTAVAQAPTALPPHDTAIPPTETAIPPTDTPAPSPTLAPTDTPAPTATATEAPTAAQAASVDSTNCVTCHTSEETLRKLAVEEAPAEKLSEGEG
jgi:mono/diheme cytochrome c family protein